MLRLFTGWDYGNLQLFYPLITSDLYKTIKQTIRTINFKNLVISLNRIEARIKEVPSEFTTCAEIFCEEADPLIKDVLIRAYQESKREEL